LSKSYEQLVQNELTEIYSSLQVENIFSRTASPLGDAGKEHIEVVRFPGRANAKIKFKS